LVTGYTVSGLKIMGVDGSSSSRRGDSTSMLLAMKTGFAEWRITGAYWYIGWAEDSGPS
jgi:hypothetical protein